MARPCTVCMHPRRAEIDRALVKGATERAIMEGFGLTKGAVHRHKLNCAGLAPVGTKQAREAQIEASRGTVALATLPSREEMGAHYATLGDRIDGIVKSAEQSGSLAVAVQGLNTLRQTFDSMSRLAGHTGPNTQVNVGIQVTISAADIASELAKHLAGSHAKIIEGVLDE